MHIKENQYISKLPKTFKILFTIIIAFIFTLLSRAVYQSCGELNFMLLYREILVLIFTAFALANIYINYKVFYSFIFKHRYAISAILFVVLVIAKINFSSIGMYDFYVQPGSGSEFVEPVFGHSQAIRSDEWAVSTPRILTYQYCYGEKYNDVVMASQTPNLQASGVLLSLAILAVPTKIGYLFLSAEYAVSFQWCSLFIITILAAIELFNILSDKKPLLATMGGISVALSSFCMWWSGSSLLAYGMATTAGIYHFLNTDNFKKRIICGVAVAIFGAGFVCTLYPAWLVPSGYIFLAIIIWSFIKNFDNIKSFNKIDWIIFSATLLFALGIIAVYYYNQLEYAKAVSETVYPGSRRDSGGYALDMLFFYPASIAFPFKSVEGGYPFSEYGTFFSFFPIPMLVSIYILLKNKKKDLLSILLLTVSLFFTVYCTIGLPDIVATVTLISFSTAARTVPMLGLVQMLLLIRSMSLLEDTDTYVPKRILIPIATIYSVFAVFWCDQKFVFQDYMGTVYMSVIGAYIFFMIVCFIGNVGKTLKNTAVVIFTAVIFVTSVFILPINVGLDAIYSKPVAQKISSIVEEDPDAKWLSLDQWVENGFYTACGAKVINFNNYIPNLEFWNTILSEEKYEEYNEIYNRYCHLIISLTSEETQPILNQPDLVTLKLNYSSLDDINAKYLITKYEFSIPEEYGISTEKLYSENGIYIYELNYN